MVYCGIVNPESQVRFRTYENRFLEKAVPPFQPEYFLITELLRKYVLAWHSYDFIIFSQRF